MTMDKKNTGKRLIQVGAFALLVFAADFVTGKILHHFYKKQKSGWDQATRYAAEETKADVLIFGASRAQQQYNPAILQDTLDLTCYNAGRDGTPFFYHYAMLQAVLKRYTPKIIILDCEYGALAYSKTSYERVSSLLPLYDDHPEIRDIVNMRGPFEKYKHISSIYPYNSMLFKIAVGNLSAASGDKKEIMGYVPLTGSLQHPVKTYDQRQTYPLDSVKVNLLKSFIDHCQQRNIQLYFVTSPYYMKTTGTDYSLATTKAIAAEKKVSFIDYSKDSFYYSRPDLFDDTVHVNRKGAEIFTASLAAALKAGIKK